MIYKFCAQTNPGLARDNNEDAVTFDDATGLGILADGMGGYNAGEVASGMATEFIHSEMARWLKEAGSQAGPRDIHRALEICVDNANLAIFNAASDNALYSGMGTTLVVGVFRGDSLLVGHIGDSRIHVCVGRRSKAAHEAAGCALCHSMRGCPVNIRRDASSR